MNSSIRTIFFAIALPTILFLVTLLVSPIVSFWDILHDIGHLRLSTSVIISAGKLSVGLHRQMQEHIEIIMGSKGAQKETSEAATQSFQALDTLKQVVSREDQSDRDRSLLRLRSIEKNLVALQSIATEVTALAQAGQREKAARSVSIESEELADTITYEIDQMIHDEQIEIDGKLSRILTLAGKMTVLPLVRIERPIEALRNSLSRIAAMNDFCCYLSWQVREAIGFTFKREKYDVENFYEANHNAKNALAAWRRHMDQEPETQKGTWEREQLKTVESDYRELSLALHQVLRQVQSRNTEEARDLLEDKIEPLSDRKLLPTVQSVLARQEQDLHRDLGVLSERLRRINVLLLLFSFCVIGLGLFIPALLYKRIVTPVLKLTEAVKGLTAGKSPEPYNSHSFREIDQLATAFNQMAGGLAEGEKAKAQLAQSEKMASVGQLAAGVAHEINNPLGIILGFAQSAARRIKEGDPLSMPLRSIERESMRCKNLVQDLLTFSRAAKDERVNRVDANAAIRESLSLLGARSKTSGIELVEELDPSLPTVKANKNQLQQVIVNLCNNAIDAMSKGGKITLRTCLSQTKKGHMEIHVRDTGVGISKEIQAHIFEPFFTTKDIGKGTGLGLSLVYEIIKKHEGSIELHSEVGHGTTFTVYLPLESPRMTAGA